MNYQKSFLRMLIFGLFLGTPQVFVGKTEEIVDAGLPSTTVIMFDGHGPFLKFCKGWGKKHPGLLKKIAQYGLVFGSAAALSYGVLGTQSLWLLAVPLVAGATFLGRLVSFLGKKKRRPVVEKFVKDDPILGYAHKEFVELESMFEPNEEVVELMKELRNNGYTLVLASNIAPDSLALLQERYPEAFEHFMVNGKLQAITPTKENGWLDKKQPEKYYQELENLLDESKLNKKLVIFIDDKQENCDKAEQKEKIQAICFTGSVADLRKKLRAKNVQVSEL